LFTAGIDSGDEYEVEEGAVLMEAGFDWPDLDAADPDLETTGAVSARIGRPDGDSGQVSA
jgi:hypothetical protein